MKPTRAGFFFRDAEGRIQADAPLQEFIVDPPGSELLLLEGKAQSALEQLLDVQDAVPHEVDGEDLPEVPKPAPQAWSQPAIPMERDSQSDPPWMTTIALAFQRDVPPREIGKAVEDGEAPRAPAVPVKEEPAEKTTRGGRWLRALNDLILGPEQPVGADRRSANRTAGHGLAAYFWDGDRPKAHAVRDISRRGVFVESAFFWPRGTMIVLTLQIGGKSPADKDAIALVAGVVRTDPAGMALRFLLPSVEDMRILLQFLLRWKPDFTS